MGEDGSGAQVVQRILVVGCGLVGLCCALSLRQRGHRVQVIDRDPPLDKASRWNAGVLATSSLWPMVNPGLLRAAPALAFARAPGFRVNPASLRAALPFALRALAAARHKSFAARVEALHELIVLSRRRHESLMAKCGGTGLRTDNGWLLLYESAAALDAAEPQIDAFARHAVRHSVLDRSQILDLEPHLVTRFAHAVWLTDTAWVREPAELGAAYLDHFRALGGTVRRAGVRRLDPERLTLHLEGGEMIGADGVVLAAGPWTADLLSASGLRLPMIAERGYVRRVTPKGNAGLGRPVFDAAGGIVLAPRPDGIQISTGTELCRPGDPLLPGQARDGLARARLLLPLGEDAGEVTAAERPTLPDGLPAIGPLQSAPRVWLATGHQHIGFSTSAGTGDLVADGLSGARLPGWASQFAPSRFGL